MVLINQMKITLNKVQLSKAAHQQQMKVLRQYYEKVSLEDFFDGIKEMLMIIFSSGSVSNQNNYVERALDFLAHFVADVTPEDESDDDISDVTPHSFLTKIIKETLKYHNLINECLRYNSCLFVRLILHYIGAEKNLDNEVCDMIQEAMLVRTLDPKSSVRLQAVLALIRLQDPTNPDCPVIKAYLSLIVDPNYQIRSHVVKCIAPNINTIPQIVNRLRDVHFNVRMAAFRRCADLGPKYFKIVERQHVLKCGLAESFPKVKNVFIENLLPKWLNVYENNYIKFMNGLKLDADENDITNTENITKDVINLLLNSTQINNISSLLPLNESRLISLEELASEAVALWNVIVNFLRENDTLEEYLEQIIPDLTPFCHYIESIVTEKGKNKMEEWEFLDYQYLLNNLFGIAEGYDLADEVGRRTLHQLSLKMLKTENLQFKLKRRIVALADKTRPETEDFTNTICNIISEIQEPLVEKQTEMSPAEETDKECRKAELKVKIIRLEADLENATDGQEFLKADGLKTEIDQLKEMLLGLTTEKPTIEMVKVTKDDPKTICNCLDLLTSLLQLGSVTTMTPSLVTIKEEFLVPLLNSNISDINWRVLHCLALLCCIDESLAEQYIKVICIPIITYRAIPNYNKNALITSVKAVCDLFRLYGSHIFSSMENPVGSSNHSLNSSSTNPNKRKLYSSEDSDESISLTYRFHLESMIEVILDMLDDESSEIRDISMEALSKLILNDFPVSSLLITRLVLKWYNPLTAKSSDKLQQLIGVVIGNYAKSNEGAREVIAKAIIPIVQSISGAPKTSPLADVDIDNLLLFLTTITNSDEKKDIASTHLNMAHMFMYEILKTKNSLVIQYLSKILLNLDINTENVTVIKELIVQVEKALNDETNVDKTSKRNITKFRERLNVLLENQNRTRDTNLELTENTMNIEESSTRESTGTKETGTIQIQNKTVTNLSSIAEESDNLFESSCEVDGNSKEPSANENKDVDSNSDRSGNESETEALTESVVPSLQGNTVHNVQSGTKNRRNQRSRPDSDSSEAKERKQLKVVLHSIDIISEKIPTSSSNQLGDEDEKENTPNSESNSSQIVEPIGNKKIPAKSPKKRIREDGNNSGSMSDGKDEEQHPKRLKIVDGSTEKMQTVNVRLTRLNSATKVQAKKKEKVKKGAHQADNPGSETDVISASPDSEENRTSNTRKRIRGRSRENQLADEISYCSDVDNGRIKRRNKENKNKNESNEKVGNSDRDKNVTSQDAEKKKLEETNRRSSTRSQTRKSTSESDSSRLRNISIEQGETGLVLRKSKVITRKKSLSRKSTSKEEDVDDFDDSTLLHTILHEIPQISEVLDMSSFNSSNTSFRSTRSKKSSQDSPVLEKVSSAIKKTTKAKKKRHSTRNAKKKT